MTKQFEQAYDNFLAGCDVDTTMLDCAEFMFNAGRESVGQGEPVAQPYAHIYEFDSAVFGTHRSFSPSQWNGMRPTRTVVVYTHPAQPVQQVVAQDAARYEYLEKFTQCIKTPNGDLAWTIQLQQVLVGGTFGKAIDAVIENEKAKGGV